MTRCFALLATTTVLLATPAFAQHQGHDHHHAHHEAHDHGLPVNEDIRAAVAAGGALITVDVLGVVCDFCATAMTKVFGRRDDVAAVYVDLDDKLLSLVVKEGAALDDATIERLVTKAGYKTAAIHRDAGGADAS